MIAPRLLDQHSVRLPSLELRIYEPEGERWVRLKPNQLEGYLADQYPDEDAQTIQDRLREYGRSYLPGGGMVELLEKD